MLAALDLARRAWSMLARVFPRCSMISQAIAFNLFLAFFPTLLIAVGVATSPIGDKTSMLTLIGDLIQFLPPGSQQIVSEFLTNRGPDAWKVIIVGWSGMLLAGTQVMRLLMEGIHLIYGNRDRFGYFHRQLRAFLLLLLTIAPLLVASVLGVFGRPLRHWLARELGTRSPMQGFWAVFFSLAAFSLGFLSLTLIYRFARPGSERWGNLFPGALVATTLWWLVNVLFGLYVRRVPYSLVYGGLAAVIGLMIWMELSVLVIFVGAAWNAEIVAGEGSNLQAG
jgi:membrane protein